MALICLPKTVREELTKRFRSDWTWEKLSDSKLDSATRRALFESVVGKEQAQSVNALFESKLLLKGQKKGFENFIKRTTTENTPIARDMLSKVEKLVEPLSESDIRLFKQDLLAQKLGLKTVSYQEAGKLVELGSRALETKQKVDRSSPDNSPSRLEYGLALRMFQKYAEDLKVGAARLAVKEYLSAKNWRRLLFDLAGTSKSVLSSLDISFFGRQGIKMLFTNPDLWMKSFTKTFGDIGRTLKGPDSMGLDAVDHIKAGIYSRENAMNGTYNKMKVAIGLLTEEAFPSSAPTRIPVIGRLFKAAEASYNGAALRMRADLADRVIRQAQKNGIDMTDTTQALSLGKLVNSMTGRGGIGKLEVLAQEVNAAVFSIKFLKSNFDTLTAHLLDPAMSKYAKVQAAKNLLKILGSTAGILVIADALWPGSVDFEGDAPLSANFGKIKIGDTRFDITGGMAAMAVLAARIASMKTKSSITGKVTKLNEDKYGALTAADVLIQFAEGKTSPALKAVIDYLNGKNFQGNRPTLTSTAAGLITPLPVTTWKELADNPLAADMLWAMLASELGIGVNTYSRRKP